MCHPPLGVGQVASAGCSVPGAVRVSGEAALGAGLPVHAAAVEGDLGDAGGGAHVQLLLQGETEAGESFETGGAS